MEVVSEVIRDKYGALTQRIQTIISVLNLRQKTRPLDHYCHELQQRCIEAEMTDEVPARLLLVTISVVSL